MGITEYAHEKAYSGLHRSGRQSSLERANWAFRSS